LNTSCGVHYKLVVLCNIAMLLRFTEVVDDRLIEIISNYRVLGDIENIDFKNVQIKKI
jgi:hypothetical protein